MLTQYYNLSECIVNEITYSSHTVCDKASLTVLQLKHRFKFNFKTHDDHSSNNYD